MRVAAVVGGGEGGAEAGGGVGASTRAGKGDGEREGAGGDGSRRCAAGHAGAQELRLDEATAEGEGADGEGDVVGGGARRGVDGGREHVVVAPREEQRLDRAADRRP